MNGSEWRGTLQSASETQIQFEPHTISESAVEFAKQLADMCDKHGISEFNGGFRVRCKRHNPQEIARDLTVEYSAADARGRPRRRLKVSSKAVAELFIDREPDSVD